MFIKEVIVEGFKSYANRTVIGPFDKTFNAITGRNGTGKSNILDSICFVLGISKLTQVRVDKMTELIYKNGQAGITKATVTIVFDNSDPQQSPVGYETFKQLSVARQIVMGGRNKYMVNGKVTKQKQIQDLFQSVQLDVNNPHFLIMQGRIVQMMNMKPAETLSLLEEASGTRMYENKKEVSVKIIEKKDRKLEEVNTIINDEIKPQLGKLQKDRAQYRQFTNNNSRIERMQRQRTAYQYFTNAEVVSKQVDKISDIEAKLGALNEELDQKSKEVAEQEQELDELSQRKDNEMQGEFEELKKVQDEASKVLVQQNSKWQNAQKNLKAEQGRLKKAHKALEANAKNSAAKGAALEEATERIMGANDERAALQKAVEDNVEELECLSAGMATQGPGQTASISEELVKCTTAAAQAKSTAKQSAMRFKSAASELKSVKAKLKKVGKASGQNEKKLEATRTEFEAVSARLEALDYSPDAEEDLQNRISDKEEKCRQLNSKKRQLSQMLSRVEVDYDDPTANFDRSKVKGIIANLATVKEPEATQALEVAAGSKLQQLVVDGKHTASQLLKKGNIKRRITIIPLDSVTSRCIKGNEVAAAKKLVGPENVEAAIDLVDFDPALRPAMDHAFGSTFICKEGNHAKEVTFNKSIQRRSVSYEGDVFTPSGTLSGGSRNSKASLLGTIAGFKAITERLDKEMAELKQLKSQLAAMQKKAKQHTQLNKKFQLLEHALQMLEDQAAKSEFGALQVKASKLEEETESLAEAEKAAKQAAVEMQERVDALQAQLDDFESAQKSMMAKKEADIKKAKKALASFEANRGKLQQQLKTIEVEVAALVEEKSEWETQIQDLEGECQKLVDSVAKLGAEVEDARADFDSAKARVDEKRAALVECDSALQDVRKKKDRLAKQVAHAAAEIKKLEHKLKRTKEEGSTAKKTVDALKAEYEWIADEEEFFGKSGTDYDFEDASFDAKALAADLAKLKKEQDTIGRGINHKVMGMIEKAESDYLELKKKRDIILADRAKIMTTIEELDARKKKALEAAYHKVNRDFGDIFSTLLPGANAKLAPLEGQDIHAGLTPMVAFSGKWKESLMELSGGQRSLLALSLVLAMLLFKPAPMYILDEVDAALDLSHTQNIGRLLKTHFSQSQFVVVSLKEGMFDNANVVFTTQNTDGVSSVQRTATIHNRSRGSGSGSSSSAGGGGGVKQKRSRLANVSNKNQ